MMLVIAMLAVLVSLLWVGQAIADQRTVRVYKNPT